MIKFWLVKNTNRGERQEQGITASRPLIMTAAVVTRPYVLCYSAMMCNGRCTLIHRQGYFMSPCRQQKGNR